MENKNDLEEGKEVGIRDTILESQASDGLCSISRVVDVDATPRYSICGHIRHSTGSTNRKFEDRRVRLVVSALEPARDKTAAVSDLLPCQYENI